MEKSLKCYWSNASLCNTPLNKFEKNVFIIASNDPSMIDIINKIKKIIREFGLEPIFAEELEGNNNLRPFCDNICAFIRGSCINIVNLTAPLKECPECNSLSKELSVNVYWEYGYAAGLEKPIIIICEESQADSIPFNIADKQIQFYNEHNIEEELGSLLKQKIDNPLVEASNELSKKSKKPLDIGKTTDLLKIMGKGEIINIIRQTSFEDLFELTGNIMETIKHIESIKEYKESDGLYSFIKILLNSPFTDEEFIKFFETIFKKFLEISDYRIDGIREKIKESIQKTAVKNWIRKNNMIDDLIKVFIESDSFEKAGINSRMVYPFAEELSKSQVIKILENVIINDQILDSFKAKPILYAIVDRNRAKIPKDLWETLAILKLEEKGSSMIKMLKERDIEISNPALSFLLHLNNSWDMVYFIISQKNLIPDFNGVISVEILKNLVEKEIQKDDIEIID